MELTTTKKPISEKRLTANRINGRKSHGPVTPKGKINSGHASAKHTVLTDTVLIDNESRPRFTTLVNSLRAEFQPQTCAEEIYVEKMAVAHWNITRIWSLQSTAINLEIRARRESHPQEDIVASTTHAVATLSESSCSLDTLSLQLQRFDYQYNQAMQGLFRRRKENRPADPDLILDLNLDDRGQNTGPSHQLNENKETTHADHPIGDPVDPIMKPVDPNPEPVDPKDLSF